MCSLKISIYNSVATYIIQLPISNVIDYKHDHNNYLASYVHVWHEKNVYSHNRQK